MADKNIVDKNFTKWSSNEIAAFIQSRENLGNYAELFQKHKIDGAVAHRLTDADLKEMGVVAVGDRHRILGALESLRHAKSQQDREKNSVGGRRGFVLDVLAQVLLNVLRVMHRR